jgi:hypothetical protein
MGDSRRDIWCTAHTRRNIYGMVNAGREFYCMAALVGIFRRMVHAVNDIQRHFTLLEVNLLLSLLLDVWRMLGLNSDAWSLLKMFRVS